MTVLKKLITKKSENTRKVMTKKKSPHSSVNVSGQQFNFIISSSLHRVQ